MEQSARPEQQKKPNVKSLAGTAGADLANTFANSLVVVAGFSWVQALQSLFDPRRGIFKKASVAGPWIVAIVTTVLATAVAVFLRDYLRVKTVTSTKNS